MRTVEKYVELAEASLDKGLEKADEADDAVDAARGRLLSQVSIHHRRAEVYAILAQVAATRRLKTGGSE